MGLKELSGRTVCIHTDSGMIICGIVSDYFFPEDSEGEIESIVDSTSDGFLIELYDKDIIQFTLI